MDGTVQFYIPRDFLLGFRNHIPRDFSCRPDNVGSSSRRALVPSAPPFRLSVQILFLSTKHSFFSFQGSDSEIPLQILPRLRPTKWVMCLFDFNLNSVKSLCFWIVGRTLCRPFWSASMAFSIEACGRLFTIPLVILLFLFGFELINLQERLCVYFFLSIA